MSQFPDIDQLNDAARAARDKCESALRFSYGQVPLKNLETGAERRVGYQQVRLAT